MPGKEGIYRGAPAAGTTSEQHEKLAAFHERQATIHANHGNDVKAERHQRLAAEYHEHAATVASQGAQGANKGPAAQQTAQDHHNLAAQHDNASAAHFAAGNMDQAQQHAAQATAHLRAAQAQKTGNLAASRLESPAGTRKADARSLSNEDLAKYHAQSLQKGKEALQKGDQATAQRHAVNAARISAEQARRLQAPPIAQERAQRKNTLRNGTPAQVAAQQRLQRALGAVPAPTGARPAPRSGNLPVATPVAPGAVGPLGRALINQHLQSQATGSSGGGLRGLLGRGLSSLGRLAGQAATRAAVAGVRVFDRGTKAIGLNRAENVRQAQQAFRTHDQAMQRLASGNVSSGERASLRDTVRESRKKLGKLGVRVAGYIP